MEIKLELNWSAQKEQKSAVLEHLAFREAVRQVEDEVKLLGTISLEDEYSEIVEVIFISLPAATPGSESRLVFLKFDTEKQSVTVTLSPCGCSKNPHSNHPPGHRRPDGWEEVNCFL